MPPTLKSSTLYELHCNKQREEFVSLVATLDSNGANGRKGERRSDLAGDSTNLSARCLSHRSDLDLLTMDRCFNSEQLPFFVSDGSEAQCLPGALSQLQYVFMP